MPPIKGPATLRKDSPWKAILKPAQTIAPVAITTPQACTTSKIVCSFDFTSVAPAAKA